jgi:hypothetical protein
MIADFNIHQPDPLGDQRNFHAHILVTTRDVGPEGFGKKNRDWHHASFVGDLRHEWARVQNRILEKHLGPDAPKVSPLSLAERGIDQAPAPKMGPSATAMQRRGEATELGARRDGVVADHVAQDAQERAIRGQMSLKGAPWKSRQTEELRDEMARIGGVLEREHQALIRDRETLFAPRPPSKRTIENTLTKADVRERRRANAALKRTQIEAKKARDEAMKGGLSARGIARWFVDPGGAFMSAVKAGHRYFDRLERADRALKDADRALRDADKALAKKRAWVRSDAGQAFVANVREPAVEASVKAAKARRSVDRRAKQIALEIKHVDRTIQDLSVAHRLGVETVKVPGIVPRDGSRETGQKRYVAVIAGSARGAIAHFPEPLKKVALQALKLQVNMPPRPARGPSRDDDFSPDF